MTSKRIYGVSATPGSDGRYHYVYRITNLVENKHYYGSRVSSCSPYEDLGIKYFSSIKNKTHRWIKYDQLEHPENYNYKIIRTFQNRQQACQFEKRLHRKFDVKLNQHFYNGANQSSDKFDTTGMIPVTDGEENFLVSKYDPRYISGELTACNTGIIVCRDKNNKIHLSNKDDPRWVSGEFVGVSSGYVMTRNKFGKIIRTTSDDPRYISGELQHVVKGQVTVKDNSGNCFNISKDDPRYISGELKSAIKGQVTVYDEETDSCFNISKDDPRYISGELQHIKKIS